MKECWEVKYTNTTFKFVKGVNKEIHFLIYNEVATKYGNADITSQFWDERVFMHFPHVQ